VCTAPTRRSHQSVTGALVEVVPDGNLVCEMPGWTIKLIDCGFHTGPHKIIITTPTGHHYLSRALDPP
jgi:hypothetical protein